MGNVLKGLTWDHPRGYAPLVAGAVEYVRTNPDLEIRWDRRSLRDFGEAPIDKLIGDYDLLIVDHPFVGFANAHEVLTDLAPFVSQAERKRLASDSVGPSWESYWYDGGLWALPIDAATQVASYRPDLLRDFVEAVPTTFDEVLDLGGKARSAGKSIIAPACPTDAISMMLSLSASLDIQLLRMPFRSSRTTLPRRFWICYMRLFRLRIPNRWIGIRFKCTTTWRPTLTPSIALTGSVIPTTPVAAPLCH